ncbi:MAG: hypothetical protein NC453_06390 [Muribaculum sp.]|nr:hypothetical protein [Muribaculum sp.]
MMNRKSPRANFHNYSGGLYFITICTLDHTRYFGNIVDDKMHLSDIGEFTQKSIAEIPTHYPYVEVPLSVVMPNRGRRITVHRLNRLNRRKSTPNGLPRSGWTHHGASLHSPDFHQKSLK